MRMLDKVFEMLSKHCPNQDKISAEVSNAIQRNEGAQQRAREALEQYKMAKTLRQLTEKMK